MPKIRCDQCQTISATTKGYCPECGAIFVPPYAMVDENGTVTFAQVREDIGQGKERKLLLKKKPEPTPATAAAGAGFAGAGTAAMAAPAPEERTLADLQTAPVVMLPAGEDAFPGFGMLLTLVSLLGWLTMLGGPLAAVLLWRETNMPLAVGGAIAGFFLGILWLVLAGGGRVLLALENHARALRMQPKAETGE